MSSSLRSLRVLRRAFVACVLVACLPAFASADVPEPSWSAIRDAAGARAWRAATLVRIDGRRTEAGLTGDAVEFVDPHDGRSDRRSRWPMSAERVVADGATVWRQDRSGGVHRLDGAFAAKRSATDAWLARAGWLAADGGSAWFGPFTPVTVDDEPAWAVVAIPRGGQPVTLTFAASTLDLVRSERVMPTSVERTRYEDQQVVDGVRLPFTITTTDVDGDGNDSVLHVDRYELHATADATAFGRPAAPPDWTLRGPSTTVPLDLRNGVLTIAATVNGRGPFRFILDTGGHAIVSPALAAQLGLDVVGAGRTGGAGESTTAERYTRVATLAIGGLVLTDQHFYVIDLGYPTWERGAGPPIGGLIGVELIERLATRIDYVHRTVTFTPFASHRFPRDAVVAPLRFDDDIPLVDAALDGRPGVFALDTGNASSIVVQRLWAERTGLAASLKAGIETASYGAGGTSRNWVGRASSFDVGGHRIDRPLVRYAEDRRGAFASRTEAGNIGTQVLAHFVVDLDYARGSIGWRAVPGYEAPPFNRGGLRALKDRPDAFVVIVVAADTPAARAGLKVDDRIVAIDGVAARELSGADFAERFAQPSGTHVRLDVVRDGAPITTDVVLAELLP